MKRLVLALPVALLALGGCGGTDNDDGLAKGTSDRPSEAALTSFVLSHSDSYTNLASGDVALDDEGSMKLDEDGQPVPEPLKKKTAQCAAKIMHNSDLTDATLVAVVTSDTSYVLPGVDQELLDDSLNAQIKNTCGESTGE